MKLTTALFACALVVSTVSCRRPAANEPPRAGSAPYREVLQQGLTDQVEKAEFPRGEVQIMSPLSAQFEQPNPAELKFHPDYLPAFLEVARAVGLIELSERRQSELEAIGNQGSRFFTVKPTEKLLALQDKAKTTDKWIHVTVGQCEVTEIIKDTEYNARSAAQGEEYRLVLGKFLDIPNSNAKALGSQTLATTEKKQMKFRAILNIC